jgi:motA/tolQ/exbB proton channel
VFFLTSAELFEKGGPMMYLLLLCSLTVAAIAIDRFMLYRRASQGARALEAEVSKSLRGRKVNELAPAAEGQDNMVAYLVRTALDARAAGEDVPMALDAAYGEAAMLLRARLNYLSMIVTMAPLMGLLGTISGMIESFSIFNLQAGQPMAITGGIGEALIATATGLLVAIFSLVVHTYFAQRMDVMLTLLEKTMNTLQAGFAVVDGGNRHAS